MVYTVTQLHSSILVPLGILCLESQYHAGTSVWLIPHTDAVRVARDLLALSLPSGERQGAAQVTLVGGEFTFVPVHARDTVERATKKKLLSSSVSQESFTARKRV